MQLGLSTEQRISNTLLANNCNLLALICQAPIAGDTAAVISKGIISLLRQQNGNLAELFLQRLLSAKIIQYREYYVDVETKEDTLRFWIREDKKKGRDLSDVIRDNSMAAMLLNAFSRCEGMAYLNYSLGPALKSVMCYMDQCEIDPQKLNAESDTDIHANEERLKQSCAALIQSIADRKDVMPQSIRRICSYIKTSIDNAMDADNKRQSIISSYDTSRTSSIKKDGKRPTSLSPRAAEDSEKQPTTRASSLRKSRCPSSESRQNRARGKSVSSSLSSPAPRPLQARCRSGSSTYSVNTVPLARGNRSRSNTRGTLGSAGDIASESGIDPSETESPMFRLFGWKKHNRGSHCSENGCATPKSITDFEDRPKTDISDLINVSDSGSSLTKLNQSLSYKKTGGSSPNLSNPSLMSSGGSLSFAVFKRAIQTRNEGRLIPLTWPSARGESAKKADGTASRSDSSLAISNVPTSTNSTTQPLSRSSVVYHATGSNTAGTGSASSTVVLSSGDDGEDRRTDRSYSGADLGSDHKPSACKALISEERCVNGQLSASDVDITERDTVPDTIPPPDPERVLSQQKSSVSIKNRESTATRASGYLSVAEKVVGSFLFLRFLIPAITAPDIYGLIDGKPSGLARRGLILSGKVLTALCNDMEFGAKESYLMSMNDFLQQYRLQIKDYLDFATSDSTLTHKSKETSPEPKGLIKDLIKSEARKRKALSASMPSLNFWPPESLSDSDKDKTSQPSSHQLHQPTGSNSFPHPAKLEARSNSSSSTLRLHSKFHLADMSELEALFTHLGHSLDIIETDIEHRIATLSENEADGVLANFFEMKRLVENSPYGRKSGSEESQESTLAKAGLLAKKISKSFKGIFTTG
ncbi:Ras GTPase activating protein ira2 [Phlyctochytrium planicorne]|nr:Ras GTPase activating protein ira2 [Phlyctochytrium planicorne]